MTALPPVDAPPAEASIVALKTGDGRTCHFAGPVTGRTALAQLASELADTAVVIEADGRLTDLSSLITRSARLAFLTRDDDRALEVLRHDCAHVLAQAVQELYPETKVAFGPATETGFYYDFYRETPFTPSDLPRIEARMREIIREKLPFRREVWSRNRAIAHFEAGGEFLKVAHIRSLPETTELTVYRQGADWLDLCRGPHAPSTGAVGQAFKLMSVAGAHFKGDVQGTPLQRIYGTAWRNQEELKQYLTLRSEAERRDHRRLGKAMRLFHIQDEAPGAIFWHQSGFRIFRACEDYMRRMCERHGYAEVRTPLIYDRRFWEQSGHWQKFRENMFTLQADENGAVSAIKPMNCPGHVQIFRQGTRSYRDLPVRLAEFGHVHRNEPSGALSGLMRVRAFTQDDGHVFCRMDQLITESVAICDLLVRVYKDFGFPQVLVKFSDRPPVRAGSDAIWDRAEDSLRKAARASGLDYSYNPGEGAFYGPKLEFILKDALGRQWQCGTLQVDFVMPERLGAAYVNNDGQTEAPVMLHRAILGSLERFIGILLEHYAGRLPLWLAPTQLAVLSISGQNLDYARRCREAAAAAGLRVELDDRNATLNYKIRSHIEAKTPYLWVVGQRENDSQCVQQRQLGVRQQQAFDLAQAIDLLKRQAQPPDHPY